MHPAEQIAIIIGRIYRSGMTTTSGGNLSIMDGNGDMWITPAGIDKGSLKPSDIMCVKADGTIVGPHRPSSEYPFHKAIYKMNPRAHSVIHAHPPGLVTFSVVHQIPDTSIIPQARAVCGPVGFAEYALPGSELLGKKIVEEFKRNPEFKAVIMENHGVVLYGEDIADAYQRFETLELCARTILNAKTLGEPKYLTEEQIVNTYFRLGMCYAHMRWDKQAFEYFDKVLEHRPNDAEVLTQKSMLYVNQENFDAALNQLKAAIENEPERKYLYRTMGIISLIMKNYDDFRRYCSISDEPLTEDELNEAIKMAETNDEFSINYLLEGVRRNLGI